ncbi:hypothetical protein [Desulfofundulus sp. TPOSR]|uniref:hypothetical protein n=1 Tax=Desulfofundulus sp. TPOSR TaxID=2714340 RepID=UPI001A9BBC12|nr:hypothetical protein [Desulfofundulus sp. TPOSR]
MLAATRNVGMVLGIALGGAILTARQSTHLDLGRSAAFLAGLQEAYLTAMLLSLIGTLVCLWAGPPRSE